MQPMYHSNQPYSYNVNPNVAGKNFVPVSNNIPGFNSHPQQLPQQGNWMNPSGAVPFQSPQNGHNIQFQQTLPAQVQPSAYSQFNHGYNINRSGIPPFGSQIVQPQTNNWNGPTASNFQPQRQIHIQQPTNIYGQPSSFEPFCPLQQQESSLNMHQGSGYGNVGVKTECPFSESSTVVMGTSQSDSWTRKRKRLPVETISICSNSPTPSPTKTVPYVVEKEAEEVEAAEACALCCIGKGKKRKIEGSQKWTHAEGHASTYNKTTSVVYKFCFDSKPSQGLTEHNESVESVETFAANVTYNGNVATEDNTFIGDKSTDNNVFPDISLSHTTTTEDPTGKLTDEEVHSKYESTRNGNLLCGSKKNARVINLSDKQSETASSNTYLQSQTLKLQSPQRSSTPTPKNHSRAAVNQSGTKSVPKKQVADNEPAGAKTAPKRKRQKKRKEQVPLGSSVEQDQPDVDTKHIVQKIKDVKLLVGSSPNSQISFANRKKCKVYANTNTNMSAKSGTKGRTTKLQKSPPNKSIDKGEKHSCIQNQQAGKPANTTWIQEIDQKQYTHNHKTPDKNKNGPIVTSEERTQYFEDASDFQAKQTNTPKGPIRSHSIASYKRNESLWSSTKNEQYSKSTFKQTHTTDTETLKTPARTLVEEESEVSKTQKTEDNNSDATNHVESEKHKKEVFNRAMKLLKVQIRKGKVLMCKKCKRHPTTKSFDPLTHIESHAKTKDYTEQGDIKHYKLRKLFRNLYPDEATELLGHGLSKKADGSKLDSTLELSSNTTSTSLNKMQHMANSTPSATVSPTTDPEMKLNNELRNVDVENTDKIKVESNSRDMLCSPTASQKNTSDTQEVIQQKTGKLKKNKIVAKRKRGRPRNTPLNVASVDTSLVEQKPNGLQRLPPQQAQEQEEELMPELQQEGQPELTQLMDQKPNREQCFEMQEQGQPQTDYMISTTTPQQHEGRQLSVYPESEKPEAIQIHEQKSNVGVDDDGSQFQVSTQDFEPEVGSSRFDSGHLSEQSRIIPEAEQIQHQDCDPQKLDNKLSELSGPPPAPQQQLASSQQPKQHQTISPLDKTLKSLKEQFNIDNSILEQIHKLLTGQNNNVPSVNQNGQLSKSADDFNVSSTMTKPTQTQTSPVYEVQIKSDKEPGEPLAHPVVENSFCQSPKSGTVPKDIKIDVLDSETPFSEIQSEEKVPSNQRNQHPETNHNPSLVTIPYIPPGNDSGMTAAQQSHNNSSGRRKPEGVTNQQQIQSSYPLSDALGVGQNQVSSEPNNINDDDAFNEFFKMNDIELQQQIPGFSTVDVEVEGGSMQRLVFPRTTETKDQQLLSQSPLRPPTQQHPQLQKQQDPQQQQGEPRSQKLTSNLYQQPSNRPQFFFRQQSMQQQQQHSQHQPRTPHEVEPKQMHGLKGLTQQPHSSGMQQQPLQSKQHQLPQHLLQQLQGQVGMVNIGKAITKKGVKLMIQKAAIPNNVIYQQQQIQHVLHKEPQKQQQQFYLLDQPQSTTGHSYTKLKSSSPNLSVQLPQRQSTSAPTRMDERQPVMLKRIDNGSFKVQQSRSIPSPADGVGNLKIEDPNGYRNKRNHQFVGKYTISTNFVSAPSDERADMTQIRAPADSRSKLHLNTTIPTVLLSSSDENFPAISLNAGRTVARPEELVDKPTGSVQTVKKLTDKEKMDHVFTDNVRKVVLEWILKPNCTNDKLTCSVCQRRMQSATWDMGALIEEVKEHILLHRKTVYICGQCKLYVRNREAHQQQTGHHLFQEVVKLVHEDAVKAQFNYLFCRPFPQ